MNDECAKGIKNEKDIERLGDKVTIMFDQLEKGLEKLDRKLDLLDEKIEELKKSIPEQIDRAVDAKWRSGVYSVVKWLVVTVLIAIIGAVVRMFLMS